MFTMKKDAETRMRAERADEPRRRLEIEDLEVKAGEAVRELREDELLYVGGGMMQLASRTTCSGGCADDCGL